MENEEINNKLFTNAMKMLKTTKEEEKRIERVAIQLKEKQLPTESILALILKNTELADEKDLKEKFGNETIENAKTIKQIEKIIEKNHEKLSPETLTSIILSVSPDFSPIIIKIAETSDALFNREKIIFENNYAKKAEEIWLPLAIKLGLTDYVWKIQDFSFRVMKPDEFEKIKKLINKPREERERLVEEVKKEVAQILEGKIKAQISGRPKNFKSIYEKMKKVPFQKMNDLYGIRIICKKEKECYEALGLVHSKYEIIPEAFDDYIAKPKQNGYKSIHTAVKRGNDIIEVQLRTMEQHTRIEGQTYWAYKNVQMDKEFEKELAWERQLIDWQKSAGKTMPTKKITGRKIFVFTPKNEAISLPVGSTPIDFAFAIHTDLGFKAEKAKINSKDSPLDTKLNNLDKVEIIVSEKEQAKKGWLNSVASEKAKTKLKAHFKLYTAKKPKQTLCVDFKKIKMAECCHPLPGEDVVGIKTTKRKIIIHKTDCKNIQKTPKNKVVQIGFEKEKGKTGIRVKVLDRPGILAEMLEEIKKSGAVLSNTNFKIRKNGYAEAIFMIEIKNVEKLEKLMEEMEKIGGIQSAERI